MDKNTPDASDDDRTVIRSASPAQSPRPPAKAAASFEENDCLSLGTRLREFEITRVLGEGGFGIVYLAFDQVLKRQVALKEYMPASLATRSNNTTIQVKGARHREAFDAGLKSFINEALLLAQFDHPSLVKVLQFWEDHGTAYMVMPFYEGTTLKDHLESSAQAPGEDWLLALLDPLTQALAVIHAQNCFHRDIAPDNILLLRGTQIPLLLDFGAARRVIGDLTHSLTVILKPGYAPIEQYAEITSMKQGPWTDVYALAAVLYRAASGILPPPSVARMVNDAYVPLSQTAWGRYSERFTSAIDNALRVRPEDRTQSVEAFREALGLESSSGRTLSRGTPSAPMLDPMRLLEQSDAKNPTETRTRKPAAETLNEPARGSPSKRWMLGIGVVCIALVLIAVAYMAAGSAGTGKTVVSKVAQSQPQTAPLAAPGPVAAPASAQVAAPTPVNNSQPPVQAAPQPPFSVAAEFGRIVTASAPAFQVEVIPAKREFQIGKDEFSMSVTSSNSGFLYVLVLDPDGMLTLIFPNKIVAANRIQAGQKLSIPDKAWRLEITPPAGTVQVLALISEVQRDYSGLGKRDDSGFGFMQLPTGEAAVAASAAAGASMAGDSIYLGAPKCSAKPCSGKFGAQSFSVQVR